MKNNEDKVLVLPGGDGIANYLTNSIENPINSKIISMYLDLPEFIESCDREFYSVWGYSKDNSKLKNEKPKEGMTVFITYENAAIYKAVIYKILEDPNNYLDVWAGRPWGYKILLKDVIKIFIPDPNNTYPNKETLDGLIEKNEFGKSLQQTKHIQELYEGTRKIDNYPKYGFSQIIGKETMGNIQGAMYSEFFSDKVEEEFERYVIKCHGECIVEVYDGIDSDN